MYAATLGETDTEALHRLHNAAKAVANARKYGTPTQQASTRQVLTTAVTRRTADVAALRAQEAQPSILERLAESFGQAGKVVALGVGALAVLWIVTRHPGRRSSF